MKNKKYFFLIVLLVFCIVLITGGFFATRSKIKANEAAKSNLVIEECFPDAVRYSDATYSKSFLAEYLYNHGLDTSDVIVEKVVYARDEQNTVKGLIVYMNCYKDYGGIINLAVGIQNNGTINGYYVLSVSDAKGMDLEVAKDPFKSQFIGKNVPNFVIAFEVDNDSSIIAVNGADDASKAIVNGMNAAIYTLDFIDESMGGLLG